MFAIILVLAVSTLVLAALVYLLNRKVTLLRDRLQQAVPHLIKGGLDFEGLQPFWEPLEWTVVAQGGNNQAGRIGNRGFCPCQSEYTVATRQTAHRQRPNAAQIAACVNNPPAPDPAEWDCPEDCVQVRTHIWHSWMIVKNRRTGQFKLNCHTFAQYHCKKPGDPAIDAEPEEGPPPPEVDA